jgi:hypothetical protein
MSFREQSEHARILDTGDIQLMAPIPIPLPAPPQPVLPPPLPPLPPQVMPALPALPLQACEWLEYSPFCLGTPGGRGDDQFKDPPKISYEGHDLTHVRLDQSRLMAEQVISTGRGSSSTRRRCEQAAKGRLFQFTMWLRAKRCVRLEATIEIDHGQPPIDGPMRYMRFLTACRDAGMTEAGGLTYPQ